MVYSTILGSTLVVSSLTISSLSAISTTFSTLQTNTLIVSSSVESTMNASTGFYSTMTGSSSNVSTLSVSSLYVSSLTGSTTIFSTASVSSLTTQFSNFSTIFGSSFNAPSTFVSTLTGKTAYLSTTILSTLYNSTLLASTMTAPVLSVSTLTATSTIGSTLIGSTLTASSTSFSTLTGSTISASAFAVSTLTYSTLTGSTVNATTLNGSTVSLSNFYGSTISTNTILVSTLTANSLTTSTVLASTIYGMMFNISSYSTSNLYYTNLLPAGYNVQQNLGIGTASPTDILSIYGASNPSFYIGNATNARIMEVGMASGIGNYATWAGAGDAVFRNLQGNIILQSGTGAGAIYINTSNNVGIGTNNASNMLTIGTVFSVAPSGTPITNTVGPTNLLVYGNLCIYRNRLIFSNSTTDFNHSIYNNGFNVDNEGAFDGFKYNGYACNWFRYGNATGATPSTGMFIDISGNVAFGTTSTAGKCRIYEATGSGPGATTGSLVLYHNNNNGVSSIVFPSASNYSSDYGFIAYYDDVHYVYSNPMSTNNAVYNYWGVNTGEDSLLLIGVQNDNVDSIVINPSHYIVCRPAQGYTFFVSSVGIGVTNSGYPLQVNGISRFTGGLYVASSPNWLNMTNTWVYGTFSQNYYQRVYTGSHPTYRTSVSCWFAPYQGGGCSYYTLYTGRVKDYRTDFTGNVNFADFVRENVSYEAVVSNGHLAITGTFYIQSDSRIKTNVQPFSNALHLINQIEIVSYDYIDHVKHSVSCVAGVIAQQVNNVLPEIITYRKDVIPNIMALATAETTETGVQLRFSSPIHVQSNDTIEYMITSKQDTIRIKAVVSAVSADRCCIDIPSWENRAESDQIFVYGTQVDDFHNIDKQTIGVLGLAGVQELDRLIQEQEKDLHFLSIELQEIRSRITTLLHRRVKSS